MPPSSERKTVYEKRGYAVLNGRAAKKIAATHLEDMGLENIVFGLAEVDDRYHVWRIPLLADDQRVGEVVIRAKTGELDSARTSNKSAILAARRRISKPPTKPKADSKAGYEKGETLRKLAHGDAATVLAQLQPGSVDLVFTSPPYYNARPEYADYESYDEYLEQLRAVIRHCHRALGEGRFFVMNVSPVLIRRENRSQASRRIPVPFDVARILAEEDFEFIDHILWEKPSGAGWATGRGRRFAADRNPLQYKAVPVTEDILVYRKRSSRLIDWNIRTFPDPLAVKRSRIADGYEQTNIWRLGPAHDKRHPAIFPEALAERVIRYYSFETDTVLDPYGGLGTAGRVAQRLNRGFLMIERDATYFEAMMADVKSGLWGVVEPEVLCCRMDCASAACADQPPGTPSDG